MVQLEKRCADEKTEKDRLNGMYLELIEKQRSYYKTVRDFQEVGTLCSHQWLVHNSVYFAGVSKERDIDCKVEGQRISISSQR